MEAGEPLPARCRRSSGWSAALSLSVHAAAVVAALAAVRHPPPSPPMTLVVDVVGDTPAAPSVRPSAMAAEPSPARPASSTAPATAAPAKVRPAGPAAVHHPRPRTTPATHLAMDAHPAQDGAEPAAPPPAAAPGDGGQGAAPAPTAAGSGGAGPRPMAGGGGTHGNQHLIDAYLAAVRRQIQQQLLYPPAARRLGLTGEIHLRFTIRADGQVVIESLLVTGGSEAKLLRDGALDTIRRIATFSPPPAGTIAIELPVLFSLVRG